jgi:membrane-associated phospholipid phosphatase
MLPRRANTGFRWDLRVGEVVAFGGLLLSYAILLLIVERGGPTSWDRRVAGAIQAIPWGGLAFVPRLGSELGGGPVGFGAVPAATAAAFVVWRRWRRLALLAALFALHAALISPKLCVTASRPSQAFGVEGDGGWRSFPSGHVQWSTSFYGFLAYLAWRAAPVRLRIVVPPAYGAIVLGTMLGRIELGRHWPIDTIAGVLAGLIALRLVILAAKRPARLDAVGPAGA